MADLRCEAVHAAAAELTTSAVVEETPVLVLGAGLAGLSAASVLERHAIVLELSDRPGGLVRTECFNGFWFDRVIHLLYFPDSATERRIRDLLGPDLKRCSPVAWVECSAGTTRFPLQLHLGGLESNAIVNCLLDFVRANSTGQDHSPQNFEELLLQVFGRTMCDIFFLPYNRKVWKRPLNELASSGFQWNIARPDLVQVLRGALNPGEVSASYNSAGWYPRPPRNATVRGMEFLSQKLADRVSDLRTLHRVEWIDLETRIVTVSTTTGTKHFRFHECCLATLPLPELVTKCRHAPRELLESCSRLKRNRVLSIALSIHGPRPDNRGHWRYYADESVTFTRLIYMHEFDPDCAPEHGWSLLVEITEAAEEPLMPWEHIFKRVRADLSRTGALPADCHIIDAHLLVIDPAYVVFSVKDQGIVAQARAFLESYGILPVGRYGRWEYSSMGQVMRDGFLLGETVKSNFLKTATAISASCDD